MQKPTAIQSLEIEVQDVQGRLSNLYLWPGTLSQAVLKLQIVRGDVVEHQEVTPLYNVVDYEVQFNYRFVVNVPANCSHVHLHFVSLDKHPISGKPKLVARARISFKDICRSLPLEKYFTLYRKDRVTQNCIAGGYIRLGFCSHRRSECSGEFAASGERSSSDKVSVCSSAREDAFPFTHPYHSEIDVLPQRPASAVPRMLVSEEIQSLSPSEDVFDTDSIFGKTERSAVDSQSQQKSRSEDRGLVTSISTDEVQKEVIMDKEDDHGPLERDSATTDRRRRRKTSQKGQTHAMPWVSALFGATLGVISTVAVIAVRYLMRRNPRKQTRRTRAATESVIPCS